MLHLNHNEMNKTINQLIEGFQNLFETNSGAYTNARPFSLEQLRKHIIDGNIIIEKSEGEESDRDVETLFNQAVLTGEILDVYKGCSDDEGHIHILDAPNLKILLDDQRLFDRKSNFGLARRVCNTTVKIFYIESTRQDENKRKEIGGKIGINIK